MGLCNVDPLNPDGAPFANTLIAAGFRGVRLVSRPSVAPYVQRMQDAGLMVLAVVTEQSGGYLCPADVYQVGNEPDVAGTGDSMSAADYVVHWNLYRETYPDVIMIGAGLASGQTSYWQAVQAAGGLKGAAGFAVHPYARTALSAAGLLKAYQKITPGLSLWVSEWHRPDAEIPAFATMLRANTVMSAWFAWGGQPNPQFNLTPQSTRILGACA